MKMTIPPKHETYSVDLKTSLQQVTVVVDYRALTLKVFKYQYLLKNALVLKA